MIQVRFSKFQFSISSRIFNGQRQSNWYILKYGFHKKYFRKNEPLTSWTLFSPVFFQISADWWKIYFLQKNPLQALLNAIISTNQHWSGKNRGKKVFNSSEFHFFGSISYEIHILGTIQVLRQVLRHRVFDFFRPTHPPLWWFTVL